MESPLRSQRCGVCFFVMVALVALLPLGCAESEAADDGGTVFPLPAHFPAPRIPEDNPWTPEKAALGRGLFHDTRLSGNGTQSCASCHIQALGFSDASTRAVGSTGEQHPRRSMALANVAWARTLNWANPLVTTLEAQALTPLFGDHPVELGMGGREAELLARLRDEPWYQRAFADAFPEEGDPFTVANLTRALASFQRTLIAADSPFDRFLYGGDFSALSPSARRGLELFFSERLECFHCHGGFNLSDSVDHAGQAFQGASFHVNALYNIDGRGGYPAPNTGVHEVTGRPEDMGRFKAPSLRNVAVRPPYMHDGSVPTLSAVVDHYAAGGRTITEGPYAGVGADHPNRSLFVPGFLISGAEREDLLAFLESLTDEAFLSNPAFGRPDDLPPFSLGAP